MRDSRWPEGQLHDVFYAGNGSLSQVLSRTVVMDALSREARDDAPAFGDVTAALKTALAWSVGFWLLLYGVIRFAL